MQDSFKNSVKLSVLSTESEIQDQKKEKKPKIATEKELKFCAKYARTTACIYGDSCKYVHDNEAYLTTKPPDISNVCPFVFRGYRCPYGIKCRCLSGHGDMSHLPLYDDKINLNKVDLNKIDLTTIKEIRTRSREIMRQEDISLRDLNTSTNKRQTIPGSIFLKTEAEKKYDKEKSKEMFTNKVVLAPMTTVGNLPFRRICKEYGADITCGEMALAKKLIDGSQSEWALLKRHVSETIFGVQITGSNPQQIGYITSYISEKLNVDYIDINGGCPIDLIWRYKCGAYLMSKPTMLSGVVKAAIKNSTVPITLKLRTGLEKFHNQAGDIITSLKDTNLSGIFLHGRTRQQRYSKAADWDYINYCGELANEIGIPLIGNGDILTWSDYANRISSPNISSIMVVRGALIKPWIFTEIKESRDWDISASERLDLIKKYTYYGLEHFGSDTLGVEKTRRFLLEWFSFAYRYVPCGLIVDKYPAINERPPKIVYRSDLEKLLASDRHDDWIKLTTMFLKSPPSNFKFVPKHQSRSYE